MSASTHGHSPRAGTDRPLRGIPRSRAFWELKAEQMMNRLFEPEAPIDLTVAPAPPQSVASNVKAAPPPPPAAAATSPLPSAAPGQAAAVAPAEPPSPVSPPPRQASRDPEAAAPLQPASRRRLDDRLLLIVTLCGVCLVSVVATLLFFGYWNRLQQTLSEERNLLLLERLRSLGPAVPAPTPAPAPAPEPATPALPAPATQASDGREGPPPPPLDEAWIEQLPSLPQAAPTPARVLRVPVTPRLGAAAVPAGPGRPASTRATPRATAPLPQLVGVVGSAGRAGSAIFLVNGASMSVSSGELIGSSGWRLRSAEGETALLERGGELRQISIVSGNGL